MTKKDLLSKLLVVDITKRLGCMRGGAFEIKSHPWFAGITWQLDVDTIGPIYPKDGPPGDTSNFFADTECASFVHPNNETFLGDQNIFAGF